MSTPVDHLGPEPEQESAFLEFLWLLWVRRGSILAILALSMGAMLLRYSTEPRVYQSETEVLVRPLAKRPGSVDVYDVIANMEPARRMATSEQVEQLVERRLGRLDRSAEVSVKAPYQSNTLVFTAIAASPVAARVTASAYAEAFLDYRLSELLEDVKDALAPIESQLEAAVAEIDDLQHRVAARGEAERAASQPRLAALLGQRQSLEQRRDDLTAPVDRQVGQVLIPADLPEGPVDPSLLKALVVGLFLGSVLGGGQALVRTRLAQRVQGRGDLVDALGAPVLGMLPRHPGGRKGLPALRAPASEANRAYARLRATLLSEVQRRSVRSLIVTSPGASERSTPTVANLGVALALAGKLVVLLSASAGRPTLYSHFPPPDGPGPGSGGSDNQHGLEELTVPVGRGLRVLSVEPAELGPDAFRALLDRLEAEADLVIVDAPPVLVSSDTLALAPLAGGVLLVAAADRTTCVGVREARAQLEQVGGRVIGAVLSNVGAGRARFEQRFERPGQTYPPSPFADGLTRVRGDRPLEP